MKSSHSFKPTIIFLLAFLIQKVHSQESLYPNSNYGIYAGLNLAFGTHVQRLGLNIGFYYYYESFQSNTEARFYRNRKNLGPPQSHNEMVLSQGILYAYGKRTKGTNVFMSSVSNQTGYDHSIAYTFNAYLNKIGTTQQTGIFALQFQEVYCMVENDLLARPSLDRFRTGAFLLMYQYQNLYQFALNCTLWTGQMGNRRELEDPTSFSHCYMDTSGGKFTRYSHGIFLVQMKAALPYHQNVQLNAGVDAEQIRNVMQNKLFHDMVILPKNWRPKSNCHIPMIDQNGDAYLYKAEQKIKQASVFLNAFLNPSVFY